MENDFGLKASFSFVMEITGVASVSYFFEKKNIQEVLVTQAFMMVKQIRLTSGILQV